MSTFAAENTRNNTGMRTAMQTALEGFQEVPLDDAEARQREAVKTARRRFYDAISGEDGIDIIHLFMTSFCIASLLAASSIIKLSTIGIPAADMFTFLLSQVFCQFSIYRREKMGTLPEGVSTSSVSRFLRNPTFRWEYFLSKLSKKIDDAFDKLRDEHDKKALVADDTDVDRVIRKPQDHLKSQKPGKNKKRKTRSHKGHRTELVARKYDHARHVQSSGYRMLTLGLADKLSFIPLGFVLLSSPHSDKIIGDSAKEFKKTSAAYKRRALAVGDTLDALITLMIRALKYIKNVHHICVDRWFSNPSQIFDMKKKTGMHVITVLKHNKTKYLFNEQEMTIAQIYKYAHKHFKVNRFCASVRITVPSKGGKIDQNFEAKVVFIKNRAKRKEWIAVLSTDIELSEQDIIEYYTLRWKIETFFWTCKMFLGLNSECHVLSYDAVVAYTTIIVTRYIMMAVEQRKSKDKRTMGSLFALLEEEQRAIDISHVVDEMCEAVFKMIAAANLSDEVKNTMIDDYLKYIPERFLKYLKYASTWKEDDDESTQKRSKAKKKKAA